MKFITTLILSSFLAISAMSQVFTNGVYVQDGKTTEVERKVYAVTPTNNPAFVYFSDDLIVKVNPGADFTVNSFFQEVLNTSTNAQRAKFGQSTLSVNLLYFHMLEPMKILLVSYQLQCMILNLKKEHSILK
jgi:hypothetical protein